MLDKTVKHYGVIMVKEEKSFPNCPLPEGYSYSMYEAGDEIYWAEIETSVGEFGAVEEGIAYFQKEFMEETQVLSERCVFIEDSHGNKVATVTAWYGKHIGDISPRLHWVSVHPEHQGKGLCKALLTKALSIYESLNPSETVYLTTQTWSYKAINIYKQFGFVPFDNQQQGQYKGSNGDFECDFEKAWKIIDEKIEAYKRG